jgi:hypothetical protein
MCDNYSKLYSSTYLALGSPEDSFLSRIELANIITRRLQFRLEAVRQAESGISIAKTTEFTLANDENEVDLTDLTADFVIPMWIEGQTYDILSKPVWEFIPTVNLAQLQQYRDLGKLAVAFYGDTSRQVKAQFSYYGQDVWGPYRIHRCWYLPTVPLPESEDDTIALPDNLVNMVQYDAIVSALPLMEVNAAAQLKERPDLERQIESWRTLYGHMNIERQEFQEFFEKWRRESRGAHRPRRRGDVLKTNGLWTRTTAINSGGGGI